MIGIILIYFIGKTFYDLAKLHNRHQWGFAILGIASYYGGMLAAGVVIGIIIELRAPGTVETYSELALGLMAIPFGILACWGLYKFLQKQWSKPPKFIQDDILDSDLMEK